MGPANGAGTLQTTGIILYARSSPSKQKRHWDCFDEIYKMPKWKNILKGISDEAENRYQFIVAGSAKIDISGRTGNSLSGRYFTFHLFPLTLRESCGNPEIDLNMTKGACMFILNILDCKPSANHALENLLEYGGFPSRGR
ncbi:MAG: AAA family ATPase [Candidatus Omnitrophota bacterium]